MGGTQLTSRLGKEDNVKTEPSSLTPLQKFCRLNRSGTNGLIVTTYSEEGAILISRFLSLLFLSFFLLFPAALISYHAVSHEVGVSIVLVFYLLACVVAQVVDRRAEMQLLLVLAYVAILSALLQGPC